MQQLIPLFQRRSPRVEERQQAGKPVRLDGYEHDHERGERHDEHNEVLYAHAAYDQHGQHQQRDAHCHRHVRLEHYERAYHNADGDKRKHSPYRRHFFTVSGHIRRGEYDVPHLGDLAGLQRYDAEVEPAAGAVIFYSHAGYEHERKEQYTYRKYDEARLGELVIVDDRHREHRRNPAYRAEDLLVHEKKLVAVVYFAAVHGGGIYHKHAERKQSDRYGRERHVEMRRPVRKYCRKVF